MEWPSTSSSLGRGPPLPGARRASASASSGGATRESSAAASGRRRALSLTRARLGAVTDSAPAPHDSDGRADRGASPVTPARDWDALHALVAEDPAAAARAATAMGAGTLAGRTGVEFTSVAPDVVVARMPVEGNTQPAGLLHGGASAALAETVGSILAVVAGGPGVAAVGVDLNATHHRAVTPARSRWVTAAGRPLHVGRTVVSLEVTVTDDDGRRVCTARLTCQLVPMPRP